MDREKFEDILNEFDDCVDKLKYGIIDLEDKLEKLKEVEVFKWFVEIVWKWLRKKVDFK